LLKSGNNRFFCVFLHFFDDFYEKK